MINDNDHNGARIAVCPKCNGVTAVVVNENISKEINKAFADHMAAGCEIKYISITDARQATFCRTGCEGKATRQKIK